MSASGLPAGLACGLASERPDAASPLSATGTSAVEADLAVAFILRVSQGAPPELQLVAARPRNQCPQSR